MKLLFVINQPATGGAEKHTYQLAAALEKKGLSCHIVALIQKDQPLISFDGSSLTSCNGNQLYNISAIYRLANIINAYKPDAIVGVNLRPLFYSSLAKWVAGTDAPIFSIFHSDPTHIANTKGKLLHFVYNPFLRQADGVIYVSEEQRRSWELAGRYGKQSYVIHNGVHDLTLDSTASRKQRQQIREQLGLEPNDIVVGLCARLAPEKNHVQLIEATKMARQRGHAVKALFIGDGPMRRAIEEKIAAEQLEGAIILAGNQTDVQPYLAASDIGCLCSTAETFSLAALEFMMAARPMIMSDIGGARELIKPGQNGYLFDVNYAADLAASIEKLLPYNTRKIMGEAAREFVISNFSFDQMVQRYHELFFEPHG